LIFSDYFDVLMSKIIYIVAFGESKIFEQGT